MGTAPVGLGLTTPPDAARAAQRIPIVKMKDDRHWPNGRCGVVLALRPVRRQGCTGLDVASGRWKSGRRAFAWRHVGGTDGPVP